MTPLQDLRIPRFKQSIQAWCRENGFNPEEIVAWKQVCGVYDIPVSATEQAKIVLTNAIIAKQEGREYVSPEPVVPNYVANEKSFRKIELTFNGQTTLLEGLHHMQFEDVLRAVTTKVPLLLVGEAGAFKTSTVAAVAKAINQKFYCQSVGAQTTKSDLMGYMDAAGIYRYSVFRHAFENGGVFLLDEIDAGNANVITCLNAALANQVCSFPDGMIEAHPDFICIAAANTFGTGASRQYVGRNQLDAASLDRFVVIEFLYDEEMEKQICNNDQWVKKVQKIRRHLKGERVVISPRASINGAKLLSAGFTMEAVLEMTILKGCSQDIKERILAV